MAPVGINYSLHAFWYQLESIKEDPYMKLLGGFITIVTDIEYGTLYDGTLRTFASMKIKKIHDVWKYLETRGSPNP
jgi:hypothetical protein